MEKLIKDFEKLCKDWKNFSYKKNGWQCSCYDNDNVDCYFAVGGNHTAVTIDGIQIQFHSYPIIEIPVHKLTSKKLESVIEKYTKILEDMKKTLKARTEEEIKIEKQKRIDFLKKQLNEEIENL